MHWEFNLKLIIKQLYRYVLIGVLSNTTFYSLYLWLTHMWGAPKLIMTVLYFVGALIGFFANRKFTFLHDGRIGAAGARYLLVQAVGYYLNLLLLIIFIDWLNMQYQIAQAIAIVVVAIFLFILLRFFVFSSNYSSVSFLRS